MEVARHFEPKREAENLARPESLEHDLGRIAVEDPEVLLQHLGERPVGAALSVGETAARPAHGFWCLSGKTLPQLAHETGLADAGVPEDGYESRRSFAHGLGVLRLEQFEVAIATDERPLQAGHAARAHQGKRSQHLPAFDRARLPFRLDRRRVAELEGAPGGGNGARTGEDLSGSRGLLESRGDVDRVPRHERAARARLVHHDVAGIYADAKRQMVAERVPQAPLHRKRGVQGPLRMILLRRGCPECGHDGVAGELLHGSAGGLDLLRHRLVEPIQESSHPFRILLVGEPG